MKILLKDAAILYWDVTLKVIQNGYVAIEDNLIKSVGSVSDLHLLEWQPDRVLSLPGRAIMPGLVNTHNHAAMSLLRGYSDDVPLQTWLERDIFPAEDCMTPEDVYWGSLAAILEMQKSGTTTFADMYFYMDKTAEAVLESGMRASLAKGMIGLGPNTQEYLLGSREFFDTYHLAGHGRIQVMLGPHALYTCPPDFLNEVIDLASELGTGIHIHVSETLKEVEDSYRQFNKSPVKVLEEIGLFEHQVLAAHTVHVDDSDQKILVEKQVGIAHNPVSNLKLASGVAPIASLLAQGGLVSLGTDGAASTNTLDLFAVMKLAAWLQKNYTGDASAINSEQILRMATIDGAKVLGFDRVGNIAAGFKADLIVIDLNQAHLTPHHNLASLLAYSVQGKDVETVIIDGNIVVENGKSTRIDEKRVVAEMLERGLRIKRDATEGMTEQRKQL